MGCDLDFRENEGPVLRKIGSVSTDVAELNSGIDELNKTLSPVYEAVSAIKASLDDDKTLIGFLRRAVDGCNLHD